MTALIYIGAALAEIAGCFAFWAWLRMGKSPVWLAPGIASLILFAWLLTRVDSDAAGRAYAAYGGIYICASLLWLWGVEGVRPDRWAAPPTSHRSGRTPSTPHSQSSEAQM